MDLAKALWTTLVMLLLAFISFLSFVPDACGITISGSTDRVGFTTTYKAADDEVIKDSVVLQEAALSRSMVGSGSLNEVHWYSNPDTASVISGVDIKRAVSYDYSYDLFSGQNRYRSSDEIRTSESLDVNDADYIETFARADNARGDIGVARTTVEKGSLKGYGSQTLASAEFAESSQNIESVSSSYFRCGVSSFNAKGDLAIAETMVIGGYLAGYNNSARSWKCQSANASQNADRLSGDRIESNISIFESEGNCAGATTMVEDGHLGTGTQRAFEGDGYVEAYQRINDPSGKCIKLEARALGECCRSEVIIPCYGYLNLGRAGAGDPLVIQEFVSLIID